MLVHIPFKICILKFKLGLKTRHDKHLLDNQIWLWTWTLGKCSTWPRRCARQVQSGSLHSVFAPRCKRSCWAVCFRWFRETFLCTPWQSLIADPCSDRICSCSGNMALSYNCCRTSFRKNNYQCQSPFSKKKISKIFLLISINVNIY